MRQVSIFTEFPAAPPAPSRARTALAALVAFACLITLTAATAAIPAWAAARKFDAAMAWWNSIPVDLSTLHINQLPGRVVVQDSTGAPYATFYSENRVPLTSLDQVSSHVVDALLAVEDDRFYTHGPIDVKGTLRALVRDQTGSSTQGGSTITQQYVKNLRLTSAQTADEKAAATESSLNRKIVELKWATVLEQQMSKDQILLGYLNISYFGNGAYGIGAAAQFYFGVPAHDLSVGQAAMLVGLLKNPTGYDPLTHPTDAATRQATVLGRMVTTKRITQADATAAVTPATVVAAHPLPNGCTQSAYPYFCQWVKQTLLDDPAFGATAEDREANLYAGGFTVHSTLVPSQMAAAQHAVDAAFTHDNRAAAAIAVVEPGTGRVTAIAQSRDFSQTQVIYPVQATVQAGSTFKPITYAAALEAGFDPATKLGSSAPYSPATMNHPIGGFNNVEAADKGPLTVFDAMKFSVNTWFVRLIEKVGTQPVADMAYRLGMTSMDPATRKVGIGDASLTLGAFETNPVDLANVYATFAANGVACRALPIDTITGQDGTARPGPDRACHQAIDPSVAATVTAALAAPFAKGGTAEGLTLSRPAVGKTGTTDNNGATWFAGYTPLKAAAVWVGDPASSAADMKNVTAYGKTYPVVFGATIAGPIWKDAMTTLTAADPAQGFPAPGPLTSSGKVVPSVVGMNAPGAVRTLQDAGLTVAIAPTTAPAGALNNAQPGVVAAQSPAGGATVTGQVTLTLTAGSDTKVQVAATP